MNCSAAQALALFIGLAIVAVALLVATNVIGDAFTRAVLIQMGAVVFGSGLTVFLLRLLSTANRQ